MGNDTTKDDGYTCSICGKHVEHGVGNNAQPVNDGRCCDDCNINVVVPRRLQDARAESAAKASDGERSAEHEKWAENHRRVNEAMKSKANDISHRWADRLSKVAESGKDITVDKKMDPEELERRLSTTYPYYEEAQRLEITETVRMFLAGELDKDFKEFFDSEFKDDDVDFTPEDASFGGILGMLFDKYNDLFGVGLTLAEAGMPDEAWLPVLELTDSFLFVNLLRVLNSPLCNRKSFDLYAAAAMKEGFDEDTEMVFTILGESFPRTMLRYILGDLVDSL